MKMAGMSKSSIVAAVVLAVCVAAAVYLVSVEYMNKDRGGLGREFDYDLKALEHIDPADIKYAETESIPTVLSDVTGVAVGPDDSIYVAGDRTVRAFSRTGEWIKDVLLSEEPRCLTVDVGGAVFVGMKAYVEVYGPGGTLEAKWEGLGEDAVITSIAVAGGNVFVADAGNRVVLRYDLDGKLLNRIGEKDDDRNIPGFVIPSPHFDLAVAPDGLLRVANPGRQKVEAYTFDGFLEEAWGTASMSVDGFCGCCNPASFAIMPDGGYVTAEKGIVRVKTYSIDGEFNGVVAGPQSFERKGALEASEDPAVLWKTWLDVAVDSTGRVLVLDPNRRTVRVFEKKAGRPQ